MAKYTITYKCGHTGTVDIVGTNAHGERERKAEWYGNQLCADCYKAQKEAEAEKTSAGYPELKGSEKQVAWAKTIRANLIKRYEKEIKASKANLDKVHDILNNDAAPASVKATAEMIIGIIESDEAKWFIEHRQ